MHQTVAKEAPPPTITTSADFGGSISTPQTQEGQNPKDCNDDP